MLLLFNLYTDALDHCLCMDKDVILADCLNYCIDCFCVFLFVLSPVCACVSFCIIVCLYACLYNRLRVPVLTFALLPYCLFVHVPLFVYRLLVCLYYRIVCCIVSSYVTVCITVCSVCAYVTVCVILVSLCVRHCLYYPRLFVRKSLFVLPHCLFVRKSLFVLPYRLFVR